MSTTAFQFLYMTLAIDITDEQGLSNEACYKFLPKKSMFAVHFTIKGVKLAVHY